MTALIIDRAFIELWSKNYDSHETDEPDYKIILGKVIREVRLTASIKKETFIQLISWKSPRLKGIIKLDKYDNLYRPAIDRCIAEDKMKVKLKMLINLYGIKIPTATTILHFIYPDEIPIIDCRTVAALHHFGYIHFTQITESNYWIFYDAIKRIKYETKASLREIDRALFSFHKINLGIRPHLNKYSSFKKETSALKPHKELNSGKRQCIESYIFSSWKKSPENFIKQLADDYITDPNQKEIFSRKGVWMKVHLNYIAGLILTKKGIAIFTPQDIRDVVRKLIPTINETPDSDLRGMILTQDVHDTAKREYNNGYPCLRRIGRARYKFIGFNGFN